MRKWRVGTISMGLVLIGTGICLFFAKINDQAIFDAVIHWWPLVFILLGLEVLVLSFWGKNNNSLVKYDIFSIFIILLIVFCGLGLYSLEGIGVTGKINDYLTSHEYHIRTSTNEIPVEPEVERLVINAPFCKLKIQTSETNIISSYSYALARADSQEAAKNLADKDTELVSSTSGNTQFISFQLPAAENVQTTEYTIIIPQNIDVELHNSYSVQIYTYELDNNWKGKTVLRAEGTFHHKNKKILLVDLPGTYSLLATSADEQLARDFICIGRPDAIIVVADATCLERNLNLVLQIMEISPKVVVCVNLMDEAARRKIRVDVEALSKELGVPCVPTTARDGVGLKELKDITLDIATGVIATTPRSITYEPHVEEAATRLQARISPFLPDWVNHRWVALRLLEGDMSIIKAICKQMDAQMQNIVFREGAAAWVP
jgi:hypothetical protein